MKNKNIKQIFFLFISFFKISIFTFGGGYAMIPLIQKEVVEKRGLISKEDVFEIIAVAESAPGPIAINTATFIGFRVGGFLGAATTAIGVILPSFLIIFAVSSLLREFEDAKILKYAFSGIKAGVLALIIKALYSMYKECPKNAISYIIAGGAFIGVSFFNINVLLVVAFAAAFGIVSSFFMRKGDR